MRSIRYNAIEAKCNRTVPHIQHPTTLQLKTIDPMHVVTFLGFPSVRTSIFCTVVLCSSAMNLFAENWPGWRGPRGDGTSLETRVPTEWNSDDSTHVAWKTPLLGKGHSSPIVWQDKIFIVGCVEETQERVLWCVRSSDGQTVWQRTVLKSPLEIKHNLNSFASGTPVTDGKFVYVSFLETDGTLAPAINVGSPKMMTPGKMVVAAYTLEGELSWIVRPSEFSSAHGFCSSPVLHGNVLVVNGDHDGDSYVFGLDRESGTTLWKFPRVHQTRSYCTPIIRELAGKTQMIFTGSKQVVSLDPNLGTEHWHVDGPTEQFVASMVCDGDKLYLAGGFPDYYVSAIRPDGKGNVTASHVAWSSTEAKCYVPSPVIVGNALVVVDDRGTLNCFELTNGALRWKERLGGHISSSLVTANGLVYCTADDGTVYVIEPGEKMKLLRKNKLGEYCFSSPAFSDSTIYFRGENHLIAIR